MRERRQRRGSWWVGKGAVALAILAALALAATVLLAQRVLDNACDIVVRGDGNALLSGVIVDLWETEPELTPQTLAAVIAKHADLRYVAPLDRQDQHVLAAAGERAIPGPSYLLGEVARRGVVRSSSR